MGGVSVKEITAIITAVAALIALVGGYVQFVVRRAILPCVEFDVDLVMLRSDAHQKVGDIVCTVKNVGPGSGYVANVQGRVRYSLDDESSVGPDGIEPDLPHRVLPPADSEATPASILGSGAFAFAKNWSPAFIQPEVTQWYRKPLMVPADAVLVTVWAAFEYHTDVGPISRMLAKVLSQPAARQGMVKYTVRRTFGLGRTA
jgi:hypothetical protein